MPWKPWYDEQTKALAEIRQLLEEHNLSPDVIDTVERLARSYGEAYAAEQVWYVEAGENS